MKKAVGVLFLAWLVSTGYIAGFATASIFYMTNVLAHVFLGAALLVAGARWLPKPALGALGVSTLLGAYLTWKGAVLENQAILEPRLYPRADAVANAFELAVMEEPEIREGLNPMSLWDIHLLRELEESGFVDELYGGEVPGPGHVLGDAAPA